MARNSPTIQFQSDDRPEIRLQKLRRLAEAVSNLDVAQLTAPSTPTTTEISVTGPAVLGRLSGTGDPLSLTGAQVTTLLSTFSSANKGLAPAPGTATGNRFLRDDGGWSAITIAPGSVLHADLAGLVADDHTQYVLRSILTADGDLFTRTGGLIDRLAIGTEAQVLRTISGAPSWQTVSPVLTLGTDLSGNATFTDLASATLNATIVNDAITNAKLRDSAALSVIGRSANTLGDPADIAGTTDQVLRVSSLGTTLGFGTIATGGLTDDAVTDVKLRNSLALSVVGRSANSLGDPADIVGTADQVLRVNTAGTILGFGTIATAGFADGSVTNAKLADMVQSRIKGRAESAGTGAPTDLTPTEVVSIIDGETITWGGNHKWVDNALASWGTGSDLTLLHDGSDSFIRSTTGRLFITGAIGGAAGVAPSGLDAAADIAYLVSQAIVTRGNNTTAGPNFDLLYYRTSFSAPTAPNSTNALGQLRFRGHDSTAPRTAVTLAGIAAETWTAGSAYGSDLRIQTIAIGSTTLADRWRVGANSTGGWVQGPDGTAGQPAGTFLLDTDTGYYRVGTNNFGISTGGTLRWDVSTTAITCTLPQRGPDGSAADTTYGFSAQATLGMFRVTTDTLGFSTASTERLRFDASGGWGLAGANFGTAGQMLTSNGSGAAPTWQNATTFSGFSNTSIPAGNTVANTASETAFTSSYTIPANSLRAGSVIRVKLFGTYNTDAILAPTLQGRLKIGGTTRLDTGALTSVVGTTNRGWVAEGQIIVHSIGGAGVADAQGTAQFSTAVSAALAVNMANTATFTLDTTATQAITVTIQWGTADTDNSITLRQMTVQISNP